MAYNRYSQITLGFIINLLLSTVTYVVAVRDVPARAPKNDHKQPEFLHHDGTVFVPGFGRYIHPKRSLHCDNPFKFNPITGTCGGSGLIVPGRGNTGSSGGARRGSVPGGDDTNVPNPGVEVPIPGNGGQAPAPSHL